MQSDSAANTSAQSNGAAHGSATDARGVFPPLWQGLTHGSLSALLQAIQLLTDPTCVHWFAHYGCALLALPDPGTELDARPMQGQVQLLLVGLDAWTFSSHSHR